MIRWPLARTSWPGLTRPSMRDCCHCERSEAISRVSNAPTHAGDCFASLAMTEVAIDGWVKPCHDERTFGGLVVTVPR